MSLNTASLRDSDLILSVSPGHDGAIAGVRGGRLMFSYEAEHDSHPRHIPSSAGFLLNVAKALDDFPAVIVRSGWPRHSISYERATLPYHGTAEELVRIERCSFMGRATTFVESTHERSHLFCSYGLSPFRQGQPCYALVWEGDIGAVYEITDELEIVRYDTVVPYPGYKYSFLFDLADPSVTIGKWRLDNAGKLMALAGFSTRTVPDESERSVINRVLRDVAPPITEKAAFKDTPYFNCSVTAPHFQDLAALFSNALFEKFHSYAKQYLTKGLPLLISGGCGLNCEWNSRWRNCGLFSDVFVPPVTNDSGIAIGSAIEAQYLLSGNAKVDWNVYSGSAFTWDGGADGFTETELEYDKLVSLLVRDEIVAWVQGRCEIGPRALGNRSLLASPFKAATKNRLNAIKQREWYRPIAPVCMEEEAYRLFGFEHPSPYMLYFNHSRVPELQAVEHVDRSARAQTVNEKQNSPLYSLLAAFKNRTGFGVLCNTSLNQKGNGFINRSSDLFDYVRARKIDAVVIESRLFIRAGNGSAPNAAHENESSLVSA